MHISTFVYGALAVVAFWVAVRLGSGLRGMRWYWVVARVVGTAVLIVFGVVMVFYAAFG